MPADTRTLDLAHVDYSALTRSISGAEVRTFRAQTKAAQRTDPTLSTGFATASRVIAIASLACFGALFLIALAVFAVVVGSASSNDGAGDVPYGGFATFLIFCGIVVIVGLLLFRSTSQWSRWMRLSGFARANGLQFHSVSPQPSYPGCIFNLGDSRRVYDHMTTASGRYLDFGNYEYSTGSGKNRQTHKWGFLAMNLDRNLPNIVLDSKANNGLFGATNLPMSFSRNQVLSLEGDFDKYFTLYCPREYEQDALYVFTPDLMALLIDDAAPFDVEIVDNWLFLYSSKPFAATAAATYQRLFGVVATVGAKTVRQTQHYRDERTASPSANLVAPQGRRLRHRASVTSLVVFAVIAVYWAFTLFQGVSR